MKIEFERLNHVMLCIPEGREEDARVFYGQVLGLTELTDMGYPLPNGAIWFQMGDIELHIRAEKKMELSQRHPAFEVKSVDAARQLLEENGVEIRNDSPIPGRKRFSFRDPFGNRIELIEMLA
jgi:catechol 2,3-dioxygenase-like lactoylglutathione lyase family enzyme